MTNMLRQGHYPLPQIRLILDAPRRTGSSDALRAAITRRQAELTQRATAMLEGSSHLHHYVTAGEPVSGHEDAITPPDDGPEHPGAPARGRAAMR